MLLYKIFGCESSCYHWSIADNESPQRPGEAEAQQHVKDITANGVGHGHVTHSCHTHMYVYVCTHMENKQKRKHKMEFVWKYALQGLYKNLHFNILIICVEHTKMH